MGMFLRRGAVSTGPKLGDLDVGTLVKLNENSSPVEFYVAKHDYEAELNGSGRTLLVRKECTDDVAFGTNNAYAGGDLDVFLNETFFQRLDAGVQSKIASTKFYYTIGNGNSKVTTLQRAVFSLSVTELGETASYTNTEGSALPIASTLRIAYKDGSTCVQRTRTPHTSYTGIAFCLNVVGTATGLNCSNSYASRPAFTLPAATKIGDGNLITG